GPLGAARASAHAFRSGMALSWANGRSRSNRPKRRGGPAGGGGGGGFTAGCGWGEGAVWGRAVVTSGCASMGRAVSVVTARGTFRAAAAGKASARQSADRISRIGSRRIQRKEKLTTETRRSRRIVFTETPCPPRLRGVRLKLTLLRRWSLLVLRSRP